jgi:hypothetical protein
MKDLHYTIDINASIERVWDVMLSLDTYKKWAKPFSPHPQFEGVWEEGKMITFIDPGLGGTKALLEIVDPFHHIRAKHIAMISYDGSEDVDSSVAQEWIGTIEEYFFIQSGDVTTIDVRMHVHENFVDMFENSWPDALESLKKLCET